MASTPMTADHTRGVLRRYREYLPVTEATPLISLGEGSTPLVRSRRIAERAGVGALYYKLEMCNPTGSFKDRGMVVAVAKAMEAGARAVMCASTGNTSASAAAYAAHAGLEAYVVIPNGKVAAGKMAQTVMYGAQILAIEGNFDDALRIAREATARHPIALVNSVNPDRIAGQKTAAFEIVDELSEAPDLLCIPVGNAGNITAYWKGFTEYAELGRAAVHPRMMGFQAAGAAPIVGGAPVADPQTVASAIRIGNPATWQGAVKARDESEGAIQAVTDDEILEAFRLMAAEDGIFCEPASAASVAGLFKLHREGADLRDATVVCVITGSGLKDPDTAMTTTPRMIQLPADLTAIERALRWT
jgi:threonine synthase